MFLSALWSKRTDERLHTFLNLFICWIAFHSPFLCSKLWLLNATPHWDRPTSIILSKNTLDFSGCIQCNGCYFVAGESGYLTTLLDELVKIFFQLQSVPNEFLFTGCYQRRLPSSWCYCVCFSKLILFKLSAVRPGNRSSRSSLYKCCVFNSAVHRVGREAHTKWLSSSTLLSKDKWLSSSSTKLSRK